MSRHHEPSPIGTSTRVRDQPSLTTSTGKSWLILGGILSLIAIGVMVPMLDSPPARLNAHPGRGMLALLATFMIAIAIVGLVCVGVVAAATGAPVY
jgi:hypothetical protein